MSSTNKTILLILLPFPLSLSILFLTRFLVTLLPSYPLTYPLVGFQTYYNYGIIGGSFTHLPEIIRVVGISTLYGMISYLYCIFFYFMAHTRITSIGLFIFFTGIGPNAWERILYGRVSDFIFFHYSNGMSAIFNIADVIQWIGLGLCIIGIIKEHTLIWHENDKRFRYIVDWKNQKVLLGKFCFFTLTLSLILGIFFYTFIHTALQQSALSDVAVSQIRWMLSISYLAIIIIFILSVLFFGLIFTHRISGPIYAFERFVQQSLQNSLPQNQKLSLRKSDYHQQLIPLADQIQKALSLSQSRPSGK